MIRSLQPCNFTREAEKTDESLRGTSFKDESLEDSTDLSDPDIIAQEIVEDLEAALSQFVTIAIDLKR
jgi:hypothetical protein